MLQADTRPDTFPKYLLANAKRIGARTAMRHKDYGIWQSWTWAQQRDEIRAFSIALSQLGVAAGDKVAIVGSNRPRLYWSFCAIQALGAVPVPTYADSVADEMAYILDHAEVKYAVVEDQEQVDKLLSIAAKVPSLKHIVYDELRGLAGYDHAALHSFEAMQENARKALTENPALVRDWEERIASGKGADLAVILYTSGTTGRPKGVMLTHRNLVSAGLNGNSFDHLTEAETIIAYLPLAWVGDHVFSYAQAYVAGYCVCCPESAATVNEDRREIAPTYFFAPPRVFESMLTQIMVRMEDASRLKKHMFDRFIAHARKTGGAILDGKRIGLADRIVYRLGEFLVYGPLKNRIGMSKMRVGYTAGEAIGPEIFAFYRSLGLNLKQLYGQTEASVYITAQPDGQIRADTVGMPSPGVEIKIADNGEVLYRSEGTFAGYFKNEQATKETKTADGWVHTGDAGFFAEGGHLKIIDRAKDVGRLRSGALFAPKYIENKLKFFPNIKEAVAFGDGRDFCAVFLNIDLTSVGSWAERNNIAYASYQDLATHPDIYAAMAEHVDQVNRDLSREEMMAPSQIRRFLVLHKELDADDGELTRTQKVRRSFIAERYGELIEALYDGSKEVMADTEVTYEDGRKGRIRARVKIADATTHGLASAAMREAAE